MVRFLKQQYNLLKYWNISCHLCGQLKAKLQANTDFLSKVLIYLIDVAEHAFDSD